MASKLRDSLRSRAERARGLQALTSIATSLAVLVGGVVVSFFSEIRIGTLVVAGLSAAVASVFKVLSNKRSSEVSRLHKELEDVAERDSESAEGVQSP